MNFSPGLPESPVPESLWDVVDAALVINLDHRTDRWEKVREHLKSIVPEEKLHRVSAVLGKKLDGFQNSHWFRRTKRPETWAGRAGCSISHRNAMRLAVDRGWKWIMLIEDDAQFVNGLNRDFSQQLATFLRTHGNEFGFVYLGFDSPKFPIRRICEIGTDRWIYQIGGASTTHAYLVSRPVMQRLLREFPQSEDDIWAWIARNVAIDRWYSLNLLRWTGVAAVSPQMAIQEPSLSDITQRASDFKEDTTTDLLQPLAVSDTAWRTSARLRSIVRPLTAISRTIKALIRRTRGF